MPSIPALNPENTTGKSSELFGAVKDTLGMVPNMMRTMGNSPAVLGGYLALNEALSSGTLGLRLGALLALTVANSNGCGYCNAAHTYIGLNMAKIDDATIQAAREGRSTNPKENAALTFARILVAKKGHTSPDDAAALKTAGFTNGEIAEIAGHVALNIFTNYFNSSMGVEVDFPAVSLSVSARV